MVSRKTQLAWMAAGGILCLITIVISCKVREGNRVTASDDNSPPVVSPTIPFVPLPTGSAEKPSDLKPLPPETATPLPPIGQGDTTPTRGITEGPGPGEVKPSQAGSELRPPDRSELVPPLPVLPGSAPKVEPPVVTTPLTEVPNSSPIPSKLPSAGVYPIPPSMPKSAVVAPPVTPPTISRVQQTETAAPVSAPAAVAPIHEPGEPPLAPVPGPVVPYHVRQGGETMADIARRTLGGAERWVELVRLNPALPHDSKITAGMLVRLPADACIPTEELEAVRPLPGVKPVKAEPVKPKVVLPLTGTYPCNLDEQRCLLLPKSIRDQLGAGETVMISPGTDQCLWLTTPTHLERLAQRMEQSQAKEVDVHDFKRLYFAQTEKVTLTAEGRVAISERLAQFAGLYQEVVLVGIDDHFELWDVSRWKDFTQKKSAAARANIAAEQE